MDIKTILVTLIVIVHFSIIFTIFWFVFFSKYKSRNGNFRFNKNKTVIFENSMQVGTPYYNNSVGVFSDDARRKRNE